ncbi:MAG TPA: hypothetical protein VFJ84_01570 [Candidatus Saccharimonadales bacterium]|nr:hypothetical protein [Candidatus Saccharimonadales bacterium]
MPTETAARHETAVKPEYSRKSFELVFVKFCEQYQRKIEEITGPKSRREGRFLGLPATASVQEMGRRLAEVTAAVGEPAQLGPEHGDEVPMKDALIYSARHLAWSAVMGGITNQYIERCDEFIQRERHSGRHNLQRLINERKAAVVLKLAHNHAIRDYFESGLAEILGNDSPDGMDGLLKHVGSLSDKQREALVSGLSLEIAAKRKLDEIAGGKYSVAYGSQAQDSIGGDLVISGPEDLIFIDLKSKMPEKFFDGTASTDLDYERGYRWVEGAGEGRQAIVWAYSKEPCSPDSFNLTDGQLAASLEAVAATAAIEKASV